MVSCRSPRLILRRLLELLAGGSDHRHQVTILGGLGIETREPYAYSTSGVLLHRTTLPPLNTRRFGL
jgi:hypothetical protein